MKSSKIFKLLGLGLLIIMASCTKAVIDDNGPTTPVDKIIKYNTDIQPIMFNHCITCHGGPAPSAGLDLSNYQNVRFSTEQGNLIGRMNNTANPMPPSGLLSATDRALIDKWVADGYLEN
jgi:hypothetical protein